MLRVRTCLAPLLLAAALAACGRSAAPAAPTLPATAPPASAAPSTSAAAPAVAPSYVARGTLLGHDGKPMKLAHVHVGEQSTPVDATGGFRIVAPGPGFFPVRFSGVDHAELAVRLYFDGSLSEVEIVLGTYERRTPPFAQASVAVYLRPESGGPPAPYVQRTVKKLANGLYGAVLVEKRDEIFYTLEDVARGHRMNGAEAESFVYDGRAGYLGQLHRDRGAFRVALDPARMPPAGLRPRVRFAKPESRAAKITGLWFDASLRVEGDAARGAKGSAWRADIAQALTSERDASVGAALRIAYLVPPSGIDAHHEQAIAVARDLLGQLPADAPLWAFAPAAAITAVELAGRSPEREAYLDRLTDRLSERDAAADFVGARLRAAARTGHDHEAARLFGIIRERFAGTTAAHAVAFYDPARHVRPGQELPDFDVPALRDGKIAPAGTRITRSSLRGKVVLLDFWGFWCVPCIAEMGNLHDVFDRYKDAGFTIVSVAVRSKVPDVRRFRASRWPMPWRHVVLDERNQDDIVDRFEIKSYPSAILIDREGKILAAGDDLRGDGLARTVAEAIRTGGSAPAH